MIKLANVIIKFSENDICQSLMELEQIKHVTRSPYLKVTPERIRNYFIKYETNPIGEKTYKSYSPHSNGLVFIDIPNSKIYKIGENINCRYYTIDEIINEMNGHTSYDEEFDTVEDVLAYQFSQNVHANFITDVEMLGNPTFKIHLKQFIVTPSLKFTFNMENFIKQVSAVDKNGRNYNGKMYIRNSFEYIEFVEFLDEGRFKHVLEKELPWTENDDLSFTKYMIG